jgi:hypothetical protein
MHVIHLWIMLAFAPAIAHLLAPFLILASKGMELLL